MTMFRAVLVLALLVLLTSCTMAGSNAPRNYALGKHPGQGLVFFSLTSNFEVGDPTRNFYLYYREQGSAVEDQNKVIRFSGDGSDLDWYKSRLVVLALAAGDYELFRIMEVSGAATDSYDTLRAQFTVEPGRALYLGQLTLIFHADETGKQIGVDNNYHQLGRDMKSFQAKHPKIGSGEISKSSFVNGRQQR